MTLDLNLLVGMEVSERLERSSDQSANEAPLRYVSQIDAYVYRLRVKYTLTVH